LGKKIQDFNCKAKEQQKQTEKLLQDAISKAMCALSEASQHLKSHQILTQMNEFITQSQDQLNQMCKQQETQQMQAQTKDENKGKEKDDQNNQQNQQNNQNQQNQQNQQNNQNQQNQQSNQNQQKQESQSGMSQLAEQQ
jgi:hypothetical protein